MSLSDCPKCWDTPCTCGYEYREYKDENIVEHISTIVSGSRFEYRDFAKSTEILFKAISDLRYRWEKILIEKKENEREGV